MRIEASHQFTRAKRRRELRREYTGLFLAIACIALTLFIGFCLGVLASPWMQP